MVEHRPAVVVFGAGRWGSNLIRSFHRLGHLAAVIDTDDERRRAASVQFGVPCFSDLGDIPGPLASRIDAAAIATPAASHRLVAMRCLDRGLDLFVEKPLALSLEDAEQMLAEARRRERVLMTGHILLYHPAIVALKGLLLEGELGDIRYIYSNRLNLGRVRREENILWSFAPHDIAVILHLVGSRPSEVLASGGSWLQSGIVDVTVTHLGFPGGEQAHVFVSWLHPHKEQKLVVVGSEKMAVFDDLSETEKLTVHDAGVDFSADGAPSERHGEKRVIELANEEPLIAECRHFIARCRDRRRPLTDGEHGLEVLRVLARAEVSLAGRGETANPDQLGEFRPRQAQDGSASDT